MMFLNVLSAPAQSLSKKLEPTDFPRGSYLGGGTAIALQLNHRRSLDLDFFAPTKFSEDQWEKQWTEKFNFKLIQKDLQTLAGVIDNVRLSLIGHRYRLLNPPQPLFNIRIASLPDLVAMKLNALIGRGTKRDFIDIYFLAKKYSVQKMFDFYDQKYGSLEERELMLKKSMIYFGDADGDEMPDMLLPADWKKIKKWFVEEVKRI